MRPLMAVSQTKKLAQGRETQPDMSLPGLPCHFPCSSDAVEQSPDDRHVVEAENWHRQEEVHAQCIVGPNEIFVQVSEVAVIFITFVRFT